MPDGEPLDGRAHGLRGRRRSVVLLTVLLAVVVLRAPLDVLVAFTSARTTSPEPDPGPLASVPVGITARQDPAVRESGAGGTSGPGGPEGRWGPAAPRPTTALVLEEMRGGWRLESGVEEAVALAVIAAHQWAATGLAGGAGGTTGGPIVVVEAVEHPGGHHAVITLLVASGAELRRIAVPVTLGARAPAIAGAAWSLPDPTLRLERLEGAAIGDPDLIDAARLALARLGIAGDRLRALEATDGWPFIARLKDDADGHPWLRWHVDRFVVTGLPLNAVRDG